jgi:hypothetical protein
MNRIDSWYLQLAIKNYSTFIIIKLVTDISKYIFYCRNRLSTFAIHFFEDAV